MATAIRILMIDDAESDHQLLVISCRMQNLPYVVDYQPDGDRGLEALLAAKHAGRVPDVVILDLDLPGKPGYELLQLIREDEALQTAIVVMLTGSSAPEDQEACGGADHYIVKPHSIAGWRGIAVLLGEYVARGKEGRPRPRPEPSPWQIPHLLHIDDDDGDRRLFARAFAHSGLGGVLHGVAGASEALLYLNRLGPYRDAPRPRLIILDLTLPHVDGRNLLGLLKTNVKFKSIPVIVLTGSESYADIQLCRDLGVDDYIVKPQTHQELIELIASFRHKLADSPSRTSIPPRPL